MKSEADVKDQINSIYYVLFEDSKDELDVRQVSENAYEMISVSNGTKRLVSAELIHECFGKDPRDLGYALRELEKIFRELRQFSEG